MLCVCCCMLWCFCFDGAFQKGEAFIYFIVHNDITWFYSIHYFTVAFFIPVYVYKLPDTVPISLWVN